MANFAQIDENNIVIAVTLVADSIATTEENGVEFLKETFGSQFNWKQNFHDGTRKNFAGLGYTYDASRDAFIEPKPFPSWTLTEATCQWDAPVAYPVDGSGIDRIWNEDTQAWVEGLGVPNLPGQR